MYNWSVDEPKLMKFPQEHTIWKLEQLINFGLGKEKINKRLLKKNINKLHIDPNKKKYLKFLLSNE